MHMSSCAMKLGLGEVLQDQQRDLRVNKQMGRNTAKRARRIAASTMRREHNEVGMLLPRDLQQTLSFARMPDDSRVDQRALMTKTRLKVIKVALRGQLKLRRKLLRKLQVLCCIEQRGHHRLSHDVNERDVCAVHARDVGRRWKHALTSNGPVEGNQDAVQTPPRPWQRR